MGIFGFSQKETGAKCCHGDNKVGIILFLLRCTFLVLSLKNTPPIFLEIFLIQCLTVYSIVHNASKILEFCCLFPDFALQVRLKVQLKFHGLLSNNSL